MGATSPESYVRDAQRIDSLDTLRGVAVLGILLMNIVEFGLPHAYQNPVVSGGREGADFAAWLTTSLLFEGTMRGLFTLLFGAGVVLFTSRLEASRPADAADLHVRRMLWLVFFGFVNSHLLLWSGDILFEYGVVGLVLYAFRRTAPHKLVIIATLLFAALTLRGYVDYHSLQTLRGTAVSAAAAEASGLALSAEQTEAMKTWDERLAEMRPSPQKLQEDIEAMRGDFGTVFATVTDRVFEFRTSFFYEYGFLEDIATMMLGIALFSLGALQGRWTTRQYLLLAAIGYGVGLTVNALEARAMVRSDFDPVVETFVWAASYELGRVPLTLGHVGLVLFIFKLAPGAALLRRFAATGRMAFTNYLTQSLICTLLFTGVGFGLYGSLARHQLYYVVAAIWLAQLIWSPWWLARFHYGPLEWLWRSLTYGRWQALRR